MGLIDQKLRVFFRSYFSPLDKPYALRWKRRLSFMYTFSSLTLFALSLRLYLKSNEDKDESKKSPLGGGLLITPHDYAKHMRVPESSIIQFRGFTRVTEDKVQQPQEEA